jgi:hypothetical protein
MKEQSIHESARLEKNLFMATTCSFDPPHPGGLWWYDHNANRKPSGIARCIDSRFSGCVTSRITSRIGRRICVTGRVSG